MRPNRVLYAAAPAYAGKRRPRKHGAKFKLNDEHTWETPDQCLDVETEVWGIVQVQYWQNLHFYQSPTLPMYLLRIERRSPERPHRPFWLI